MSIKNIIAILGKEARMGPKNPLFLFIILVPAIFTLVFQLLFGSVWQQKPAIGIFEEGRNTVTTQLKENVAIRVVEVQTTSEVRDIVENKRVDIGVEVPSNFVSQLKENETVDLQIYVDGESLAKNRTIAAGALIDTFREISPSAPKIDFQQVQVGQERALSIIELALPLVVLYAILLGSFSIPATLLVQEKERKTINALLVTSAKTSDVLIAYGILGVVTSMIMGTLVVFFNVGFSQPWLLFVPLILGSVLVAEWGLLAGLLAKNVTVLFASLKGLGIFFVAPGIIKLFPNWPQWLGNFFPTHYIIDPVFRISVLGEGWSEVTMEIYVLAALTVAFFIPVLILSKNLKRST
jgi:ABC-2 type transport system permease protein